MDILLTPKAVGEITGLSEAALAQMRYRGSGPVYRALSARTIRYREADVQAWIDASARTQTGELQEAV
ncbi:helix-turn-helix domain-containing protein [Curtobacterium flaccumfaciens pv. betae]|uniref:helix-turn-helix transcriptional regulator n=1 Tax=Curtobacterium flaccumfaciens TaxID=2035 RepID=UPI0026590659|nr:helix-turn-helix domain-containing protein [Curtobacterium flaccumfaciens]MCS5511339.1 helix-turn-helix domain-containing protein [Curtobacterium flaccumfaciens pv. betae]